MQGLPSNVSREYHNRDPAKPSETVRQPSSPLRSTAEHPRARPVHQCQPALGKPISCTLAQVLSDGYEKGGEDILRAAKALIPNSSGDRCKRGSNCITNLHVVPKLPTARSAPQGDQHPAGSIWLPSSLAFPQACNHSPLLPSGIPLLGNTACSFA